ncbi:MAG: HAD family hydrolase, partial [Lachnospiraceae bacterium]|nr:HAD family hydrolase [Lachnospiraceae bacterium]
ELCKKVSILPQECLMVGNDTEEDMIAETVGMKVFLLTDCLINKKNRDISAYPHGGFEELLSFIERLA